jgi:predicted DNA-binding protein YlxM (UPF0122 family)
MARGLTRRLWVIRLVDTYGRVLTARQQRLLHLYYLDDLSLGEIAARLHVTRQAIFDSLRRSVREFERIEASLGIAGGRVSSEQRQRRIRTHLEAVERAVGRLRGHVTDGALTRITTALTTLRRTVG